MNLVAKDAGWGGGDSLHDWETGYIVVNKYICRLMGAKFLTT